MALNKLFHPSKQILPSEGSGMCFGSISLLLFSCSWKGLAATQVSLQTQAIYGELNPLSWSPSTPEEFESFPHSIVFSKTFIPLMSLIYLHNHNWSVRMPSLIDTQTVHWSSWKGTFCIFWMTSINKWFLKKFCSWFKRQMRSSVCLGMLSISMY